MAFNNGKAEINGMPVQFVSTLGQDAMLDYDWDGNPFITFWGGGARVRVNPQKANLADLVQGANIAVKGMVTGRKGEDRKNGGERLWLTVNAQEISLVDNAGHFVPWTPQDAAPQGDPFAGYEPNLDEVPF